MNYFEPEITIDAASVKNQQQTKKMKDKNNEVSDFVDIEATKEKQFVSRINPRLIKYN